MRSLLTYLFIAALLIIESTSFSILSQETIRYGISNGLSSDEVTAVCQNEKYYWIGTSDGLARFDGLKFRVYKKTNIVSKGISSNNIEILMTDSEGRMWIGYKTTGVDIYFPRKDIFVPVSSLTDKPLPHRVISLFEDSEHCIWLGSWEDGIFQLIPDSTRTKYKVLQHFRNNIISSFLEKPKGYIWIGTYYGGHLYNIKNKSWQAFGEEQTITSLTTGGENEIFYSTWNRGIKKITYQVSNDSLTGITERDFYDSQDIISKMLKLDDQSLALGSWGDGVSFLRNDKNRFVRNERFNSMNDKTSYINILFQDESGALWIGTYGNGLLKFTGELPIIEKQNFQTVIKTPVSSIYKLPGKKILLGTRGQGCFLYDQVTGEMKPEIYNSGNISGSYLLSALSVDNMLLLGSDDTGLAYKVLDNKELRGNTMNKMVLNGNEFGKISAIFKQNDIYYFGTKQNGFFTASYNSNTKEFTNFKQHNLAGRDEITGFAGSSDNKVWISAHNGLFLYNYQSETLDDYSASRINEAVYCLKSDTVRNRVWVGTSSGVFYIENNSKVVRPIEANEILPSGSVKTLLLDRKSNLWFTTANRLFLYKADSSRLAEINIGKFVQTPVISSELLIHDQQETLLLGSSEGVTRINIDEVYNISDRRKVILTDVDINLQRIHVGDTLYGEVPLKESAEYINELRLSYKSKWLTFYFSGKGNTTITNQYQYRIGGFSTAWENFEISNPITISQLPPGVYKLEVREYTGEPSQKTMWSLNLIVSTPFWQSVWFRISELVFILFLIIIFTVSIQRKYKKRLQTRLNTAKKEQEIELLKEKESFFMGLSHDILTPFTLILSPARDLFTDRKITNDNKKKVEVILKNANFLSDMFSTILDFKQAEITNDILNPRQFELIGFSRIILNSFQYLADSKKIALIFKSNVQVLKIRTDSVKYERVLYNLLANSLKYTPDDGRVTLTINSNKSSIEILIEDTGYGINARNKDKIFEKFYRVKQTGSPDNKGFGLGLYIVRKFIAIMGGEIALLDTGNTGTTFAISLPNSLICDLTQPFAVSETEGNSESTNEEHLKPTLLLVEDNDEMRDYLSAKLSFDFNVLAASNGIEAMALAVQNMPEIIVADLMMPVMDGLELCTKIKKNESLSDIFFILITARNSFNDEVHSYNEGVDIFIRKPFDIDVLIRQIKNILSTRLKQKSQILHKFLLREDDSARLDTKDIFIRQALKIVEDNISDSDFRLDEFASLMNVSLTVLHRKFKVLLGETPNQFIRTVRLKKAEYLLLNSEHTISEIAYLTGFRQSHYFIKCFREIHSDTPKTFRERTKIKKI